MSRRRWVVVTALAVVVIGALVWVGLAVVDLVEGFAEVAEVPAPSQEASPRPIVAPTRRIGMEADEAPDKGADVVLTPSVAPGGTRAFTIPLLRPEETDALRAASLRRAARERWRASQTPEELEARRARQEARRAAMSPGEALLRDQRREQRRLALGETDLDEDEAP